MNHATILPLLISFKLKLPRSNNLMFATLPSEYKKKLKVNYNITPVLALYIGPVEPL